MEFCAISFILSVILASKIPSEALVVRAANTPSLIAVVMDSIPGLAIRCE